MDIISYNKAEDSKRRSEAKEMTFEEEKEVIEIINRLLNRVTIIDDTKVKLIQKFIDNYQNLNHHMITTRGLYATDSIRTIEKIKKDEHMEEVFWEITY